MIVDEDSIIISEKHDLIRSSTPSLLESNGHVRRNGSGQYFLIKHHNSLESRNYLVFIDIFVIDNELNIF